VVARVGPRRGPKKWASVASPANAGHEISPPPSRWRPGVRSRSTWVTVSRWPEFQGSAEKWDSNPGGPQGSNPALGLPVRPNPHSKRGLAQSGDERR
jgi:hypothetical protein